MASEGSPCTGLPADRPIPWDCHRCAGTRGSQGVPANSRRRTDGLPVSAPLASRWWKSLALPIELAARTPRRLHADGGAAVDEQRRARDVARRRRAEEHRRGRELLDRAEAPRRDRLARGRLRGLAPAGPCAEDPFRGDPP